jgi:small-conductance mechanosensitive channel
VTYYPVRRAEVLVPFSLRTDAERVLSRLIEETRLLPDIHQEPAPDAKIQDFRDRAMNVLLGAWCDTEKHAAVSASLNLVAGRVMQECRGRAEPLTAKSSQGDAQPE